MVGIDEVGRGCWAGPLLVVAARQIDVLPSGLKDSKLLSGRQRQQLFTALQASCEFGEGWVEPAEIDELGLGQAMKLAVARALAGLKTAADTEIIMDGAYNYCPEQYQRVSCVIKADALHPIVSAASVYAKVQRDAVMAQLAEVHPGYGFERHVGYGTAQHRQALSKLGPCAIHRRSFKPLAAYQ